MPPATPIRVTSDRPSYRPDIDGLRALAVLLVVGFHAAPNSIRGGYVGVDVFFVISGYLITALILRDIDLGRFSYTAFYARRVRRIFPALFVVLAAVLLAGIALLLPGELRRLGRQVVSASMFYSNVEFWTEAGYFEPASNSNTLLHIWSLGVEEQFYFIWPTLIVFALAARRYALAMSVAFAGSLILAIGVGSLSPSSSFFLTPMRLWEFIAGAFVLWAAERHAGSRHWTALPVAVRTTLVHVGSVVGFILIALAGLGMMTTSEPWNRVTLAPVIGAALVIAAGPAGLMNRLLALRPSVFVGRISYSLYLWHWPILSFLFITSAGRPTPQARLVAVALAGVLAIVSWVMVETPIRERRVFGALSDRVCCGLGFATALVFALAGGVYATGMVVNPFAPTNGAQEAALEPFIDSYGQNYVATFKTLTTPRCGLAGVNTLRSCPGGAPSATIVLWGDSHAEHLYPGLAANLPAGANLLPALTGCAPVVGKFDYQDDHCAGSSSATLRAIASERPATVVLAGRWKNVVSDPLFLRKLDETVAALRQAGVGKVVVVGPVPEWSPDLYLIVARRYLRRGAPVPSRLPFGYTDEPQRIDRMMADHFVRSGVEYVSIQQGLCSARSGCLIRVGDDLAHDLIAWDYGHFTARGSLYVASTIIAPHLSGGGAVTVQAERRVPGGA
jgi:peptidoglycan/LPS O-acetylase OafA/YrhL